MLVGEHCPPLPYHNSELITPFISSYTHNWTHASMAITFEENIESTNILDEKKLLGSFKERKAFEQYRRWNWTRGNTQDVQMQLSVSLHYPGVTWTTQKWHQNQEIPSPKNCNILANTLFFNCEQWKELVILNHQAEGDAPTVCWKRQSTVLY